MSPEIFLLFQRYVVMSDGTISEGTSPKAQENKTYEKEYSKNISTTSQKKTLTCRNSRQPTNTIYS
jgi:hypothetical protein